MNMSSLIEKLPSKQFFRISRFYTINLKFLRKVERRGHYCLLADNDNEIRLKASAKNLKELENFF